MRDWRTRSADEAIAAVDGWAADNEARHHAKLLGHEVRKLRATHDIELRAAQAEVARLTHALVALQREQDELAARLERIASRLDECGVRAPIGGST